jgi:hypothetical protein
MRLHMQHYAQQAHIGYLDDFNAWLEIRRVKFKKDFQQ